MRLDSCADPLAYIGINKALCYVNPEKVPCRGPTITWRRRRRNIQKELCLHFAIVRHSYTAHVILDNVTLKPRQKRGSCSTRWLAYGPSNASMTSWNDTVTTLHNNRISQRIDGWDRSRSEDLLLPRAEHNNRTLATPSTTRQYRYWSTSIDSGFNINCCVFHPCRNQSSSEPPGSDAAVFSWHISAPSCTKADTLCLLYITV